MKKIRILITVVTFVVAAGAAVATHFAEAAAVPLYTYMSGSTCVSCSDNPANAMQCTVNNTGAVCECVSPVAAAYFSTNGQCLLVRRPYIESVK